MLWFTAWTLGSYTSLMFHYPDEPCWRAARRVAVSTLRHYMQHRELGPKARANAARILCEAIRDGLNLRHDAAYTRQQALLTCKAS